MTRKTTMHLGLTLLLALLIAPTAQAQVSVGILIDAGDQMGRLMDKVNEGVEVLLDELDDDDEVFVLSFGRTPSVVFEMTADADKDDVQRAIGRISTSPGDPTLFPTLQMAYEILEGASNEWKALVIVTTGGIVGADLGRSREMVYEASDLVLVYGVGMPMSAQARGGGGGGGGTGDATNPGNRGTGSNNFDAAITAEEALKSFADATGAGYGVKPIISNRLSRYNVKDIFAGIAAHLKQ